MGWEDFEGERIQREENKEIWGDATDDASTEAEGKREDEGKVQNEWGETKDVRDAIDDDDR